MCVCTVCQTSPQRVSTDLPICARHSVASREGRGGHAAGFDHLAPERAEATRHRVAGESQGLPSATGLKLPRGCGVREGAGSDEGLGSSQPGLRLPALGMALGGLTALGGVVDRGRTPS